MWADTPKRKKIQNWLKLHKGETSNNNLSLKLQLDRHSLDVTYSSHLATPSSSPTAARISMRTSNTACITFI